MSLTTSEEPDEQPMMPDLDIEERRTALSSLGPESRRARDERKRGIVIEETSCPLLVVAGTSDGAAMGWDADWLKADTLMAEGASHWGLVLNRRVLSEIVPRVIDWIASQ